MHKNKVQKKNNVAQKIHYGFKKYGNDFCLNKKANYRDRVYEPGFFKYLSEVLEVSQSSINEYNIIRKNGSTALLDAVCNGIPIKGVRYSLHLASRRLSEEIKRKKSSRGPKKDGPTSLRDAQGSKLLHKFFGVVCI